MNIRHEGEQCGHGYQDPIDTNHGLEYYCGDCGEGLVCPAESNSCGSCEKKKGEYYSVLPFMCVLFIKLSKTFL